MNIDVHKDHLTGVQSLDLLIVFLRKEAYRPSFVHHSFSQRPAKRKGLDVVPRALVVHMHIYCNCRSHLRVHWPHRRMTRNQGFQCMTPLACLDVLCHTYIPLPCPFHIHQLHIGARNVVFEPFEFGVF